MFSVFLFLLLLFAVILSTFATTTVMSAPCKHQKFVNISKDNVFLYHVLCKGPQSPKQIISFTGPKVKAILDVKNAKAHLLLTNKIKIKTWSGLSVLINRTHGFRNNDTFTHYSAVHLHNEIQLGDLLLLIIQEFAKNTREGRITKKILDANNILNITAETIQQIMNKNQPPVVITNSADENWFEVPHIYYTANIINIIEIQMTIAGDFLVLESAQGQLNG